MCCCCYSFVQFFNPLLALPGLLRFSGINSVCLQIQEKLQNVNILGLRKRSFKLFLQLHGLIYIKYLHS